MKKIRFNLKVNVNTTKEFFLSIKKIFPLLVLILFIPAKFQFAEENVISIQGKDGAPFFDRHGNLNIVYITSYGRIGLLTQQESKFKIADIQNIHYTDNISSICTKRDKIGRIWLVWEERGSERSDVYIAQLRNNKIVNPAALTDNMRGFNFSPNINFSLENDLFMAWVNYYQKKYTIVVKNVTTNQCWHINSYSALDPQLIIDGTGKIWLFWVGQLRNYDEILYTTLDGEKWKEPSSLNQFPDVPHITPSIALDFYGFPHVVWSSYDGDDYELYYSYWDGNKWHKEEKITNNINTGDTFPCISLFLDGIPTVAWVKSINCKHEVWLIHKNGEEWSHEIKISDNEDIIRPPKLISSGGKIGVLWQTGTEIKAFLIQPHELQEIFFFPKNKKDSFLTILELDKNKYIGFGNSITYGIINLLPAPDKGYIPRLEKLIDDNISNSTVLNRGAGGEYTSEGLSRINSVINSDKAKTIFLMEGTNDMKDTKISIDTAAFNLQEMAKKCLDFEMTVFLSSIIPRLSWSEMLKERILGLNNKIRSIASNLKLYFVDQFNAFYNYPGGWTTLYSDATHPNETGYQLMANTWYKSLEDTIQKPSIEINKDSLFFEGQKEESNFPPQVFKIRNSGVEELTYNISADKDWMNVSPETGDSKGEWDEIQVSVDISNLSYGTYQGEVVITSNNADNSPQKLTVYLNIKFPPSIEINKDSLFFEGQKEESNFPPQVFKIRNSGVGELTYNISADKDWMNVSPETGNSKGEWDEIQVSVDISNLSYGTYQGEVVITSNNADNSPQKLTVYLNIELPPLYSPINFHGEKKKNRSLFQVEYINILAWEANPQNKDIIEKYKIYLIDEGENILLREINVDTFEYWIRKVDKDKVYKYGLTAFDIYGRESDPVYTEVE